MAGTLLERQLDQSQRGSIRYALATKEDESSIRCLLRENPIKGEIEISVEYEPDYFRGSQMGGASRTILAKDDERIVCMGKCSVQERFINGQVKRVGYLGELRLDRSVQGRFDILRRGYQFFRKIHEEDPLDFYFTSVGDDNVKSQRFLERGLRGMPRYEMVAKLVTLLIPVPAQIKASGSARLISGSADQVADIASCLNSHARHFQLSSFLTTDAIHALKGLGLCAADFFTIMDGGKMVACASLWDQRSVKQVVIRGYSRKLMFSRPWINFGSKLLQTPRLPDVHSTLASAYISPLAIPGGNHQLMIEMIESILPIAGARKIDFVIVAFDSRSTSVSMSGVQD
jgi:hypothetical protein